jgi:AraC family transcriptional regulator
LNDILSSRLRRIWRSEALLARAFPPVIEKACANQGDFVLSRLLDHGHDIRVLNMRKSPVPLHCMAISAGYEQRRNEVYSWDGLQRGSSPFVVIQHTLVGLGRLDFAGVRHRLRPGDTMVLTLPHAHRYWLERGGHWEYFWMVLNGREALRLAREVIAAHGPVLTPPSAIVDRLAEACLTLVGRPDISGGDVSAAAYAAMAALHDCAFGVEYQPTADLPAAMQRVARYVEMNIASVLPVGQLAAVAEMSRAHFVRQFTATFGMPPSEWVLQQRLDRAERLLVATDMTVATIADLTGFSSGNYLCKSFRRLRHTSPLQFRKSQRING